MKLPEHLDLEIVDIVWVDSCSYEGWVSKDTFVDLDVKCRTLGFVVAEDDNSITIAASLSFAGNSNSPIRIPKCAIKSHEIICFE